MITRPTRGRPDDEAGDHPAGSGAGAPAGAVAAQRALRRGGCLSADRLLRRDGPPGPRAASRGGLPRWALRLAPLVVRRPRRAARPRGARVGAPRTRGHVAVERHRRGSARPRQRGAAALRPPTDRSRSPLLHRLPLRRRRVRAPPPRLRRRRPSGPRRRRRSARRARRRTQGRARRASDAERARAGERRRRRRARSCRSHRRRARTADDVRLDAAQRAAVEHGRGPARVLAPAGSGKTKTLISRVAELVARGVDPGGILLLAFNRKAAEQLEERLAAQGIATTRRIRGERGLRPAAVHCATFNAFGYRYQREIVAARFTVDTRRRRAARPDEAGHGGRRRVAGGAQSRRAAATPWARSSRRMTRVRAGLEAPAGRRGPHRIGRRTARGHGPVRRGPRPLHARPGGDGLPVVRRPDLPGRGRHARRPGASRLHREPLRPHPRRRVPGPQRRPARAGRRALPAATRPLRGGRRRPAHLRVAVRRPARHPRVPRAHAAAALVGHLHAVHQLPLLARSGRVGSQAGGQQHGARGQGREAARGGRRGRAALRRFAHVAGARRGALRLSARREVAPAAAPGATSPCCAATARSSSSSRWRSTPTRSRARRRSATSSSRIRRATLLRAYIDLVGAPDDVPGEHLRLLLNRPNRYLGNAAVEAVGGAPRPWAHLQALAAGEPAAGPRRLSALVDGVRRARCDACGDGRRCGAGRAGRRTRPNHTPARPSRPPARPNHTPRHSQPASSSGPWSTSSVSRTTGTAAPTSRTGSRTTPAPSRCSTLCWCSPRLTPDPAVYLAVWDRLLADELAHAGMADDTLAREEAEEDRVVIGTIHAAKGASTPPSRSPTTTATSRAGVPPRSRRSGASSTSASPGRATRPS